MTTLADSAEKRLRRELAKAIARGDEERERAIKRELVERRRRRDTPLIVPSEEPVRKWWQDD